MTDEPKFSDKEEIRNLSIKLKGILESKLSFDDLRDFCFEMHIDYDNIGGGGLNLEKFEKY